MKKSILHAIKKFLRISVILFILFSLSDYAKAQGSIPGLCAASCNNQVNVSLDAGGYALIEPVMVWEEGMNIACFPLLESIEVQIVGATNIVGSATLYGHTVTTHSALLNCLFIDQNVEYKLVKTYLDGTVNNCWGHILVEDKIDPNIVCSNLEIECNEVTDSYELANYYPNSIPNASDNCDGSLSLDYVDVVDDYGCTNQLYLKKITRTWTATDDSGNSASCQQTIYIKKADATQIMFPENLDDITGDALDCTNPNTDPSNTGFPTFNGKVLTNDGPCKFSVGYTDQVLGACGGGYKIIRSWTVLNWCTSEVYTDTQVIKILDSTGPSITCPSLPEIGTTSNACSGNVILPAATITDDCSDFTVVTTTPLGDINGNGGLVANLPLGTHTITYTATDACGNVNSCSFELTVIDNVPPVAICDEHTVVSLISDGTATVPASTFDDGSFDNCGAIEMKVRRMDNPGCPGNDASSFDDYVSFTCCDIGSTVMVVLRVRDDAGNVNTCMVEVTVEDKLNPVVVCPPNKTINCHDDYLDTGLTGEATGHDNCGDVTISHLDISTEIDQCGLGYVIRQWIATDDQGLSSSCLQTINIVNNDVFDGNIDIVWPIDYEANTCGLGLEPGDLQTPYNEPVITKDVCDQIAISHEDIVLTITPDACYKILRKWIVIDWCQYEANNPNTDGRWEHTQVLKILNSNDPTLNCAGDSVIDNFEENCGSVYVELFATGSDDCTDESDLEYSYYISSGISGTGKNASQTFGNGVYTITWSVTDGCGNVTTCIHDFEVRDAKKPTPVCINGLSTDLMPTTGMVTIWASDFEAGSSFDNCTHYEDLIFSFSSDVTELSRTYDCNDLGQQTVEFWATDSYGNQDYCETYIIIQDNNNVCGVPTTYSSIEGYVENEAGEAVEDVVVSLVGSTAEAIIIGSNGSYLFPNIENGNDYEVVTEKTINPSNGVSTFDLVLMSKHILGIQPIDSPYKMIAADINRSNTITTFDIVQGRRLILNIDDDFQNNTSWRFVDADFVFPNPANPFATAFPEVINIDNLSTDEIANFIGIKIGDVNGSAQPNNLLGTEIRNTNGVLLFDVKNKNYKSGETVVVDFKAKDFNGINGFQFTLNFVNTLLEFVDFKSGIESIDIDNFGLTMLEEGIITVSWNEANAKNLDDETVIFSLVFETKDKVELSQSISISSRVAIAEAYQGLDELLDVQLVFDGAVNSNKEFEVMQNVPNPFKESTVIPFTMPEAGTVSLKLVDVTGKILKIVVKDFDAGSNQFELTRNDVPNSGIIYYQIETGQHVVTKKMIMVN